MAIRFALAALLLVVGASAQQFATHETIRELPKACQQLVSGSETTGDWSSSSPSGVTGGVCKLLPPVYDSKDQGYDFCLKCKAGEKYGVSAEELAQSIRQQVERKLKQSSQFTRKSKLDIIVDGVKKPVDLTRVLARTPDVLEQVDDVFFFFPNGQIGRIEFEHGQADQLARITCRAPCRGGPRMSASASSSRYPSSRNTEVDNEEDDDQEDNVYGSSSSSNRYLSQQELKKKSNKKNYSPYSYEDSSYGSSSSNNWRNAAGTRRQQPSEEDEESYPSQQTSAARNAYRTNAGRYASSSRLNKNRVAEEDEDDK